MSFDADMYASIRAGAQSSARAVVPLIVDLFHPTRVLDVGCGEGWWAQAFAEHGVDAYGIDREEPPGRADEVMFVTADLTGSAWDVPSPDLVLCLEVAEHLPHPDGFNLIGKLCAMRAPIVFSAAVPGQPGHGHVNCRWPSYWSQLFHEHGYAVSGGVRWRIWDDARVEPWYRQNLLVAVPFKSEHLKLSLFRSRAANKPLDVLHPAWDPEYRERELTLQEDT